MQLHIIYTESQMLLSKKPYGSWRAIQDEYGNYKTSLGPWGQAQVIEYLADEYREIQPPAKEQVESFMSSLELIREVTFSSTGASR